MCYFICTLFSTFLRKSLLTMDLFFCNGSDLKNHLFWRTNLVLLEIILSCSLEGSLEQTCPDFTCVTDNDVMTRFRSPKQAWVNSVYWADVGLSVDVLSFLIVMDLLAIGTFMLNLDIVRRCSRERKVWTISPKPHIMKWIELLAMTLIWNFRNSIQFPVLCVCALMWLNYAPSTHAEVLTLQYLRCDYILWQILKRGDT